MNEKSSNELVRIGFFREMSRDLKAQRASPSIRDYVSDRPQDNEEKVVAYLRGGICLGASAGFEPDVFDPSSRVALCAHLISDGVYLWRLDLAHYVEKYHVRLPPGFLSHMASVNWEPPSSKEADWD
jgi:hypothetical protein